VEAENKPRKHKNLDLILLLSILACSMVYAGSVAAQTGNQAEGEDVDIYVDYGGFAFQSGKNPSDFIAFYTPTGALNTSNNEFYIGPEGGGMFDFVSNESFTLQILMSTSANIQGDQGQDIRGVTHDEDGLSEEYPIDEGDHVIVYWMSTINYPFALPIVSFWGMIGGGMLGSVFLGATIKRKNLSWFWAALICFMFAFICYLIFVNL
jgi:hypothetical protein